MKEVIVQQHIKNKHTDDLVDHYWGSINYLLDMVRTSEIKAGLILSFYGIILNLIYQSLDGVMETVGDDIGFIVISGVWFVTTCVSMYYSIRCFMPRLEKNYEKNVFFFGDIISSFGDIKSFSKTFYEVSTDEDQLFDQLGQQVFINAKIAAAKFKNVNKSLKYLAIGLMVILFLLAYYFVILSSS